MPEGYVFPEHPREHTYESFRRAFEWDLPESYNIATACLTSEASTHEATALYHVDESGGHHEFSYEALDEASDALAAELHGWGVSRGSHVALCFPQSPELLVAHLATYKLGAVSVPLSVLLGRAALAHSLSHSGTEVLLVDAAVRDGLDAAADAFDAVDRVVDVSLDPAGYGPAARHLGGLAAVADPEGRPPHVAETGPDTPALLLYTSGTTGRPKGVLQGHRYLIGSLPGNQLWYHLFDPATGSDQRVWTPSEWAWAGALFNVVFPTLALGGTVVSSVRRSGFDPEAALAFVDETGVTRAFLPPTALSRIREAVPEPATRLPTLEVVQSGGEALNPAVQAWVERELDLIVNEAYGQTEANALVGNCRALFELRPGSMGRPYPGHDVLVLDEGGEPLGPGELGELAIEGPDPTFLLEYWDDPAATDATFTDDGALKTGDMVELDEDGYVWFRGRKDDLIVSSGYRVSPIEVEATLETHPLVSEAVVGGVPGPDGTTRIKAYLRGDADGGPSETTFEELRQLVRTELGAHKTPDAIEVLAAPPLTRTGKMDRAALFDDG